MAGIYIHIPFCRKACHYCNFHFSTSLQNKEIMIQCIAKELSQRAGEIESDVINTIYFGGGTPSLLHKSELNHILLAIKDNYTLSDSLEITLEANPDDINEMNISDMAELGINRLSIGIQSFSDQILHQLNRTHNSQDALNAVRIAQKLGIHNISVDLMFGLPSLEEDLWKDTLHTAIDLNVPHLSCYNLTLEENTALWHFVHKGKIKLPPEKHQESQFFLTHEILTQVGYNHYELSNYSQNNFESNHNSNYWNREAYLGIGPSAHSFIHKSRRWNISNNSKYISLNQSGLSYFTEEILTAKDQFNEMIMLGLRTLKGISKDSLNTFSYTHDIEFKTTLKTLIQKGIILDTGNYYKLSFASFYLCDHFSSELFITE